VEPPEAPGSPFRRLGSEPQSQWVASLRICSLPVKHLAPFPPFFGSLYLSLTLFYSNLCGDDDDVFCGDYLYALSVKMDDKRKSEIEGEWGGSWGLVML